MIEPHDHERSLIRRRDLLKTGALVGAAAALVPGLVPHLLASPRVARGPTRVLRFAHLTDLHIQPERSAAEGVAACLRHAQGTNKPDLIVTGGDLIMDGYDSDEARTKLQWDLIREAFKNESSTPVEHCLGNHDIWGWQKSKSKTTGTEPLWGKKWALEQLGLERPYHSFERAGWRFVILDSVAHDPRDPNGYIGELGEEQFAWLAGDLAAAKPGTPVVVISHIPILSATVLLGNPGKETGTREVSSGVLHADSSKIRDLFAKHPNVKLCLSGHMHRIDRVDFRGVTYLCDGAVCANWWKGNHYECNEGYGIIDLFDDGTFEHRYVTYGWKAKG